MVVATEAVEAGRAIENAFVSPDRTLVIFSTHRVYAIGEKVGPEGTVRDSAHIAKAAETFARRVIAGDLQQVADQSGSIVNAVLLGLIAASKMLPVPLSAFEQAVSEAGVAVDSNLRGLAAGFAFAGAKPDMMPEARPAAGTAPPGRDPGPAFAGAPEDLKGLIGLGADRLAAYQDEAYAARYLEHLAAIFAADRNAGGAARDFALSRTVARRLARWMAYEDVIRVAALKTRAARHAAIGAEAGAAPGEPLRVIEYLRPGAEEVASMLPPVLARPLLRRAAGRRSRDRAPGLALKIRSHTVTGFAALRLLASLRWLRPYSGRFGEERALYGRWLEAIHSALGAGYDVALEVAACAALIRGYGAVHARGRAAFESILDSELPAVLAAGAPDPAVLRQARLAALGRCG